MQPSKPFHHWTLTQMLGEEPIPGNETPDLAGAPLSLMERWHAAEARVRSKALDDYNAWVHELDR